MSAPDVVVVGGGPGGSAAAIRLARSGARVVLLERQAGAHHKVCGEFLSVEAGAHIRALGIVPARLGAVPVQSVRVACGNRAVRSPLPFPAESLSRSALDEALLGEAAAGGVEIRRGVCARSGEADGGGVRVTLSDGSALSAAALFLATGKHDLRGFPRGRGVQDGLIGFKMHLDLAPAAIEDLEGTVELLLFPGGYAGLQPLGGGAANLCLLVSKARHEELGRSWPRLVTSLADASPIWQRYLDGARQRWARPLSIYGLPYGYVAAPGAGPVFRLGDQMAVIPSFAGDGIAIALGTAGAAADAFLADGPDSRRYHREAAQRLRPGIRVTAWGSRLLEHRLPQELAVRAAAIRPGILPAVAAATRLGT